MMNKLIDLAAKLSGLGWVWEKIDGYKTKLAAAAGILSGAAGLIGEIVPLLDKRSFAALLEFVKHLPQDPAWLLLVGGLGALGLGHKADKIAAATPPAPPQN